MNLFELILKQMRQRLLSTLLTGVSILLGMMLATSVMILGHESRNVFAQADYGYELIVGPKASPLQLVMNTVYHIDVSPGNIPYGLYEDIATGREYSDNGTKNQFRGMAAWAVPIAVGDSYHGRRIVGTSPLLFGADDTGKPLPLTDAAGHSVEDNIPVYRDGKRYSFSEGHCFAANKLEAVVGCNIARDFGLKIGSTFKATHGVPTPDFTPFDEHEVVWTVVGVLNETHTANDNVLFIPVVTFYAIYEHEQGEQIIAGIKEKNGTGPASQTAPASEPAPATATASAPATEEERPDEGYIQNADGTITDKLPKKEWEISAILVHTKSPAALLDLQFRLRNLPDAIAASPADVMGKFFDTFLPKVSLMLIIISTLVTVVAGVSIMVSIYNSVMARRREIAIMRALGATKERILAAVCLEAGFIGALGGVLGLAGGHLLTALGSLYMQHVFGTTLHWWHMGWPEFAYLGAVIIVSLLAGLVPALKAYKTPVAENLVAG
jgi:putative ABC transport system permease protein